MVRVTFSQVEDGSENMMSHRLRTVEIDAFDFNFDYLEDSDDIEQENEKNYLSEGISNDYRAGRFYAIIGRASERSQNKRVSHSGNLRFQRTLLSRDHAIIFYHNGDDGNSKLSNGLYIVDLDSKFHTSVNDKELDPKTPHLLKEGDKISLGCGVTSNSRKPLNIKLKSIFLDNSKISVADNDLVESRTTRAPKAAEQVCGLPSQNDGIVPVENESLNDTNKSDVNSNALLTVYASHFDSTGVDNTLLPVTGKDDGSISMGTNLSNPSGLLDGGTSWSKLNSVTFADEPIVHKSLLSAMNRSSYNGKTGYIASSEQNVLSKDDVSTYDPNGASTSDLVISSDICNDSGFKSAETDSCYIFDSGPAVCAENDYNSNSEEKPGDTNDPVLNDNSHYIFSHPSETNSEIKRLKINKNRSLENSSKLPGLGEAPGADKSIPRINWGNHSNKRSLEAMEGSCLSNPTICPKAVIQSHSESTNKKAKLGIFIGGILVGSVGTLAALVASNPN